MATTYPGTIQTFTNPSGTNTLDNPDHATQHANENDTLIAIQNTLGTTAGTAMFTAFTASDKPAKKNNETFGSSTINGGTLNTVTLNTATLASATLTGGTINNAVVGSPTVTGGTLTSPVLQTSFVTKGVHDAGNTGTALTISAADGDRQKCSVTGNVTFTWSNFAAGSLVKIYINEDATGGHTITLPSGKWEGGSAKSFTTTANAKNTLIVDYDGTDYMYQLVAGWA